MTDPEYTGVCIGDGCPVPHDQPDVSRETSGPAPVIEGKFAIYETPSGGYHLVYRPTTAEDDCHFEIPDAAVKLMHSLGGNSPGPLGRMLGRFLPKGLHNGLV